MAPGLPPPPPPPAPEDANGGAGGANEEEAAAAGAALAGSGSGGGGASANGDDADGKAGKRTYINWNAPMYLHLLTVMRDHSKDRYAEQMEAFNASVPDPRSRERFASPQNYGGKFREVKQKCVELFEAMQKLGETAATGVDVALELTPEEKEMGAAACKDTWVARKATLMSELHADEDSDVLRLALEVGRVHYFEDEKGQKRKSAVRRESGLSGFTPLRKVAGSPGGEGGAAAAAGGAATTSSTGGSAAFSLSSKKPRRAVMAGGSAATPLPATVVVVDDGAPNSSGTTLASVLESITARLSALEQEVKRLAEASGLTSTLGAASTSTATAPASATASASASGDKKKKKKKSSSSAAEAVPKRRRSSRTASSGAGGEDDDAAEEEEDAEEGEGGDDDDEGDVAAV